MPSAQRELKRQDSMLRAAPPSPITRSIVFDGRLRAKQYEQLPRPWAHNGITTSKYTWWNFLPKNLFEQFRKSANLYFLVMVILMIVGQTGTLFHSSLTYTSTLGPLVLVMLFTMLMEIKDDAFRHKQDHTVNKLRMASVVTGGEVIHSRWMDVRVGQIVLVRNQEEIPADLVLLSSSKVAGISYVETSNIDGETNLKLKLAVPALYELVSTGHEGSLAKAVERCARLTGTLAFEAPNSSIRTFEASIEGARFVPENAAEAPDAAPSSNGGEFSECHAAERVATSQDRCAVGPANLLLRGSKIRNTPWVLGIVAYTGEETKVMMNSRSTRTKLSSINRTVNITLRVIFGAMVLLTSISVIVTHFFRLAQGWDGFEFTTLWYINNPDITAFGSGSAPVLLSGPYLSWLGDFLTYFVLYNNFIPISLYVTLEICNFCQAMWINNDEKMFYRPADTPALVRSSALSQELGQIEYLFSDKTGTLTRNEMVLKKFTVCGSGQEFSIDADNKMLIADQLSAAAGHKETTDSSTEADNHLRMMLTIMAVAHTVVVEEHNEMLAGNTRSDDEKAPASSKGSLPSGTPNVSNQSATKERKDVYNAESPDEGALVDAARTLGFTFRQRNMDSVSVEIPSNIGQIGNKPSRSAATDTVGMVNIGKPVENFKILAINQFSSTRKRMSVLCQLEDGRCMLFVKGADNVMFDLAAGDQQASLDKLHEQLSTYARSGLRTLVMGYRYIDDAQCEEWVKQYATASNAISDRRKALSQAARDIEKDLVIVGATAIEDKLQTGVPEAIADLQAAGIKIWVLTGDKMETAINIGYSSNVLTQDMVTLRMDTTKGLGAKEQRQKLHDQFVHIHREVVRSTLHRTSSFHTQPGERSKSSPSSSASSSGTSQLSGGDPGKLRETKSSGDNDSSNKLLELAMVISGPALAHVLADENLTARFLRLGQQCKVVIACRVSPLQKAKVVRLVRYHVSPTPVTLAIGDGANDVSMIQEAHVGVGISGKEGLQAVNNSDFAIAQFAYLRRLLLIHGRWNYRRVCKVILYSFYKNIAFVFVAFFYNFFSGWSGMSLYEGLMGAQYNLILALPIIATGVFDKDASDRTILRHPGLYISGRFNLDLNVAQMVKTICLAIFHAAIVFAVPSITFYGNVSSATTLPVFGMIVMTCLIITMQYRVFFLTATWNWLTWVFWFGSFLLYVAFLFTYSNLTGLGYRSYKAAEEMSINPLFWLVAAGVPLAAMVLDVFLEYLRREFFPNPIDISLELEGILRKSSFSSKRKTSKRHLELKEKPSSLDDLRRLRVASFNSREAIFDSFSAEIASFHNAKAGMRRRSSSEVHVVEQLLLEESKNAPSSPKETVEFIDPHNHRQRFAFSTVESESSDEECETLDPVGEQSPTVTERTRASVSQLSLADDGVAANKQQTRAPISSRFRPQSARQDRPRLHVRLQSAPSFDNLHRLRAFGGDAEPGSPTLQSRGHARISDHIPATPSSSSFSATLTTTGGAKHQLSRGKTQVFLPPQQAGKDYSRTSTHDFFNKTSSSERASKIHAWTNQNVTTKTEADAPPSRKARVDHHPMCQQALPVWQPTYKPMLYFAITAGAALTFALFGGLLYHAHQTYV